jgi:hypothetical protein
MNKKKKVLLVEPNFPYPNKSKNKANSVHKNFVPIGLLKLGALHRDKGDKVKLVRGQKNKKEIRFDPDEILVTSLFTYWSNHVWDSIEYYRKEFPKARIKLGGIYATLHKDTKKFKKLKRKYNIEVFSGVIAEAEKYLPDYSLLKSKIDYHATHMMRGCIRKCEFCGTWKIEPKLVYKNKEQIIEELKEIGKNKVIFYDNNLLANPHVKDVLKSFQSFRINEKPVIFESQSGFDGRILEKIPELMELIKKARFQNIRIAWDNGLNDKNSIKKQIDRLIKAGYPAKDISVFMIYNFDIPLKDMIKKQKCCLKWGVQITDCRNRPLNLDYDNYKPHAWRKGQTYEDYYIHKKSGWTDYQIRLFRSLVRTHNIFIRYVKDKIKNFENLFEIYNKIRNSDKVLEFMKTKIGYSKDMEKWSAIHYLYKFFKLGRPPQMMIIENNPRIKNRIERLRKLMHYHKKFNIPKPDLSNYPPRKLDRFLKNLFKEKEISQDGTDLKLIISNINKANETI